MLAMCFLPLLFGCVPEFQGCKEPDGSRRVGVVPPFHGQPAPPGWLRTTSQVLVALHCRHYIYEAYGDDRGAWLVRYRALPDQGEPRTLLEQVFLFATDFQMMPAELRTDEVRCKAMAAHYQGRTFALVDRRDLMKP